MSIQCPKCDEASKLVQQWLDKQGHERCWYYPDIFRSLAKVFGLTSKLPSNLPPRKEFENGCKKYQQEEYSD